MKYFILTFSHYFIYHLRWKCCCLRLVFTVNHSCHVYNITHHLPQYVSQSSGSQRRKFWWHLSELRTQIQMRLYRLQTSLNRWKIQPKYPGITGTSDSDLEDISILSMYVLNCHLESHLGGYCSLNVITSDMTPGSCLGFCCPFLLSLSVLHPPSSSAGPSKTLLRFIFWFMITKCET